MERARKKIVSTMNVVGECWDWSGCVQSNGYGRVTYKRKTMGAHRLSYLAFKGEIGEGLDVCHKCDNRACVNPNHLFTGTRKQNMEDCVIKNRQAKGDKLPDLRGEKTHLSKLKEAEVLEIRRLKLLGEATANLATMFAVSQDNIRCIIRRDTWRHI